MSAETSSSTTAALILCVRTRGGVFEGPKLFTSLALAALLRACWYVLKIKVAKGTSCGSVEVSVHWGPERDMCEGQNREGQNRCCSAKVTPFSSTTISFHLVAMDTSDTEPATAAPCEALPTAPKLDDHPTEDVQTWLDAPFLNDAVQISVTIIPTLAANPNMQPAYASAIGSLLDALADVPNTPQRLAILKSPRRPAAMNIFTSASGKEWALEAIRERRLDRSVFVLEKYLQFDRMWICNPSSD